MIELGKRISASNYCWSKTSHVSEPLASPLPCSISRRLNHYLAHCLTFWNIAPLQEIIPVCPSVAWRPNQLRGEAFPEEFPFQLNPSADWHKTGPFKRCIEPEWCLHPTMWSWVSRRSLFCLLPYWDCSKMRPFSLATSFSLYLTLASARANSSGQSLLDQETRLSTKIEIPSRPLSSSNRRTWLVCTQSYIFWRLTISSKQSGYCTTFNRGTSTIFNHQCLLFCRTLFLHHPFRSISAVWYLWAHMSNGTDYSGCQLGQ